MPSVKRWPRHTVDTPCRMAVRQKPRPLHRPLVDGEDRCIALADAVALHDDMAAKARLVGPDLGQRMAQVGLDQPGGHDISALGQGCGIDHGDILPRRPLFFYPPAA